MEAEERAYRTYVTDSLRLIPQMMYLGTRFAEAVGWTVGEPERTAEEIVEYVLSRMGE